ncbi:MULTISPECIES: ferritin [Empedobacter]|uniref:Ferritin n=1 Tax=Empedobacter falsenii TaxID=343874 RepID=A0A3R8TMJ1_9FLAO|nr:MULTISPECIES: ferritin [Empedobacter]MDH0657924.1 ferritin [Empedobacter sp. GD03865]MDH1881353.1 ferritin [Empedobacter sp. GD03797]MDM1040266.1 ferritin [Empedobacter brevis]MDM1134198.1 ferritin [Empedobacter sp. R750]RRT92933.1 ferritin [Empedobacter falsenii]
MIKDTILDALNKQIKLEGDSSQLYLAMASWAEVKGLEGTANFLYSHADEERMHMLKLIKFINERGGKAFVPQIEEPKQDFTTLKEVFTAILNHECFVSESINDIVGLTLEERDYSTHNFLQWYVSEQIEEEKLARNILDKLEMIGSDKGGLYLFDRDVVTLSVDATAE